jgi:hypothetical protein
LDLSLSDSAFAGQRAEVARLEAELAERRSELQLLSLRPVVAQSVSAVCLKNPTPLCFDLAPLFSVLPFLPPRPLRSFLTLELSYSRRSQRRAACLFWLVNRLQLVPHLDLLLRLLQS